jgi:hypothetical protein
MMLKRKITKRRRICSYDGKQQYKVSYYGFGSELWNA